MLHGMHRPGAALAIADHIVDAPGRGPHQVGACFIVVGLFHCYGRIVDDRLEQGFAEAILQVAVGDGGKIGLQHMRQDVG